MDYVVYEKRMDISGLLETASYLDARVEALVSAPAVAGTKYLPPNSDFFN